MGKTSLESPAARQPADAVATLNLLTENAAGVYGAAELVLRALADVHSADGYQTYVDADSAVVLRLAGIDPGDKPQMRKEIARVRREMELRDRPHSTAELAAAEAELAAAKAADEQERSTLTAQLEEVQAKLAGLVNRTTAAERRVERVRQTREAIRSKAPQFLLNSVGAARRDVAKGPCGRRVSELQSRIAELNAIVETSPHSETALAVCRAHHPELLEIRADGGPSTVNVIAWCDFQKQCQAKEAPLQAEVAAARLRLRAELQEAEEALVRFVEQGVDGIEEPAQG